MNSSLKKAVGYLNAEICSLVIVKDSYVGIFYNRGILDLFNLYTNSPEVLKGASVADKVVGKGAAAIMVEAQVASAYAEVLSRPALEVFRHAGIEINYGLLVPNIINRKGTGICPVESLCSPCLVAADCIPLIRQFVNDANKTI